MFNRSRGTQFQKPMSQLFAFPVPSIVRRGSQPQIKTDAAGAFEWSRSKCLALALHNCSVCHGAGLKLARRELRPCKCVLRAIFRICYRHFMKCVTQERHLSQVLYGRIGPASKRRTWGRPNEEFIADFCLLSRRALDEPEHRLFRYHYLLGADWSLCTRKLGITRGDFFHAVYRVEQKLGLMFAEVKPFALFPIDQYYASTVGRVTGPSTQPEPVSNQKKRNERPAVMTAGA